MDKAVFLDRDGVINKAIVIDGKPFPPASVAELEILPGVKEGIAALREEGYKILVVTNQPDVGRKKTNIENVVEIHEALQKDLQIDQVYACYHDGYTSCECRKPNPGMILQGAREWNIDLDKSFMIGDRWRDVEAAKNAGVKAILIDYSYDEKYIEPDHSCSNFSEAVKYILHAF